MIESVEYIIVHCADTPDDRDVDATDIHLWHKDRGFDGIGYHAVIKRDGDIEAGRPLYWDGAHAVGHNHHSIGICLVGRDRFSEEQMTSLESLIEEIHKTHPKAKVVGHRDLDPRKTCPNFDVSEWYQNLSGGCHGFDQ